jgi:hypothetical protein
MSTEATRSPLVVRAGDLQALADRLDARAAAEPHQIEMGRVCRHAAVTWVQRSSVSIR